MLFTRNLCEDCYLLCMFEGECPCKNCLVKASCRTKCLEAFKYWTETANYMIRKNKNMAEERNFYKGENEYDSIQKQF